jgi:hypothetical protein
MGALSVFTGAVYLLVSPPLSHRPFHSETDSVGATPFVIFSYGIIPCIVAEENPYLDDWG